MMICREYRNITDRQAEGAMGDNITDRQAEGAMGDNSGDCWSRDMGTGLNSWKKNCMLVR